MIFDRKICSVKKPYHQIKKGDQEIRNHFNKAAAGGACSGLQLINVLHRLLQEGTSIVSQATADY